MRTLITSLGAWCLAAAPAASQTAAPPSPPAVVSDSQEIALGAALAIQFDAERGIQPMEQDRRIEAYLQTIADSVAKHARRRLPWRIHYDPHPGFGSGFALPGGHIVIGGGILALMKSEDEAAAVIAHEIEHIDLGQVSERITTLVATDGRSVTDPTRWKWGEFGRNYGEQKENLCDFEGAKLLIPAGYSPFGYQTILETFLALANVHSPKAPPPQSLVTRIDQIKHEVRTYHWEKLTKTRPLALPYM